MTLALPRKTRDYIGPVSDTRAWDGFALRDDDVIISTPPKSGTTWTQTIVMMLLRGEAELDDSIWHLSPWIDCVFRPEARDVLAAQTTRRAIKSHAPLDGISYAPDPTYIAVYRHPVDVHFSLKRHADNMKDDTLDFIYPGDTGQNFDRFLTHPTTKGGTDDTTLAAIVEHFQSFRRWAHLPNIHLFHYATMQRDLAGQVARLNEILGTGRDAALLARITAATEFSAMKESASRHLRSDDESPFKDELEFFATARSGKWQGRLDDGQMARFDKALAALLEPTDAHWLAWATPAR